LATSKSPKIKELSIPNNNAFLRKLDYINKIRGQLPKNVSLPTVPSEGGFFKLGNHKVTGDELNNLTENIQDVMIHSNESIVKVASGLASVVETINELDSVYLKSIYLSLNTSIKAIEDVRIANEKISEHQVELNSAQSDIKDMINQQQLIIDVLKSFKTKIEKYKHLNDIDKTFTEVHSSLVKLQTLEKNSQEHAQHFKSIDLMQESLLTTLSRVEVSDSYANAKVKELMESIETLKKSSNSLKNLVDKRNKIQDKLSNQLKHIDENQNIMDHNILDQKNELGKLAQNQLNLQEQSDKIQQSVIGLNDEIHTNFADVKQRFDLFEYGINQEKIENAQRFTDLGAGIRSLEGIMYEFDANMKNIENGLIRRIEENYYELNDEILKTNRSIDTLRTQLLMKLTEIRTSLIEHCNKKIDNLSKEVSKTYNNQKKEFIDTFARLTDANEKLRNEIFIEVSELRDTSFTNYNTSLDNIEALSTDTTNRIFEINKTISIMNKKNSSEAETLHNKVITVEGNLFEKENYFRNELESISQTNVKDLELIKDKMEELNTNNNRLSKKIFTSQIITFILSFALIITIILLLTGVI